MRKRLKRHFMANSGIFIASPEYNASITPLLKNTLDWVSRVRDEGEPPLAAYKNRVFALGGASPGNFGAMRSHDGAAAGAGIGCGAMVIPEHITVRDAGNAFDEKDNLKRRARREALLKSDRAAAGRSRAAGGVTMDWRQRRTG